MFHLQQPLLRLLLSSLNINWLQALLYHCHCPFNKTDQGFFRDKVGFLCLIETWPEWLVIAHHF